MSWKIHKKYVDRDKLIKRWEARDSYHTAANVDAAIEWDDKHDAEPRWFRARVYVWRTEEERIALYGEEMAKEFPWLGRYKSEETDEIRWYTPKESNGSYLSHVTQEEFWQLQERWVQKCYERTRRNMDDGKHGHADTRDWKKLGAKERRLRNREACRKYLETEDEDAVDRALPESHRRKYDSWWW